MYILVNNKLDLALNKPQGLICHKTQPNQTIHSNTLEKT